jgi:glycosyltransferase involved in cell wall biosynthesis
MKPPPISVLLPTYNCEVTVRDTLESVKWADEILVVDSYSTDDTTEICRKYGARIVQHDYINSAKQKNWAVPQCCHKWVLQIDSDEVLEQGLRQEIINAVATAPLDVHAFRIPRKNIVLGKWMRYGGVYPDYQIRLFRKNQGCWREREVHAHLTVPGEIKPLRRHILHNNIPNISKHLRNLDRYTSYEANERWTQGKRFRSYHLILYPSLTFLKRYITDQGFRDGWRGFILCAYIGMYVFWYYAKLWEMDELDLDHSPRW